MTLPPRARVRLVTPSADEQVRPDLESKVRSGTKWSALNSIVVRVARLRSRRCAGADGVRARGLRPVRGVAGCAVRPAEHERAGHQRRDRALGRRCAQLRADRVHPVPDVKRGAVRGAVRVCSVSRAGTRLTECDQHVARPVHLRGHRRRVRRPARPAHQGVRSGPSAGGRPAQLRGRHDCDGLAGVLRAGRDELRVGRGPAAPSR